MYMTNLNVLVAYTPDTQECAATAAKLLSTCNISTNQWQIPAKPDGRMLLELRQHSNNSDAAIFILQSPNKSGANNNDIATASIFLSIGIFASINGGDNITLLTKDFDFLSSQLGFINLKKITRPGDLERYVKSTAQFIQSQATSLGSVTKSPVQVICHPTVAHEQINSQTPDDWFTRAMYLGTDGARAWLKTSNSHEQTAISNAVRKLLERRKSRLISKNQIDSNSFRTFVSLGPGSGKLDERIIKTLKSYGPTPIYIPVDISAGLIWQACKQLSDITLVPAGILADFETSMPFVSTHLKKFCKAPHLYGLLGNTFGNLDGTEDSFADDLASLLDGEDEIFIDAAISKSPKPPPVNLDNWKDENKKYFFAHGAAKKLGNISTEDVINRFSEIITVDISDKNSAVAHTTTFEFKARGKAFAYVRRYNLSSLKEFLEKRFRVDLVFIGSDKDPYNYTVMSLTKK
jgi:hypothetical protein